MSDFYLYFSLGIEHILDINGFDHILFVIALCSSFHFSKWKQLLTLITAFTAGHSLTLSIATLNFIHINSQAVEFLIPVTILIAAVYNIIKGMDSNAEVKKMNYIFALFFGFIHGLGFSNYLKSLLGKETSIIPQLFSFNVGLELGQIIIISGFMLFAFILVNYINISRKIINLAVSSGIACVAIVLMNANKFW